MEDEEVTYARSSTTQSKRWSSQASGRNPIGLETHDGESTGGLEEAPQEDRIYLEVGQIIVGRRRAYLVM